MAALFKNSLLLRRTKRLPLRQDFSVRNDVELVRKLLIRQQCTASSKTHLKFGASDVDS